MDVVKINEGLIKVDDKYVPIGTHFGKTIVFGCDHRGYRIKKEVLGFLKNKDLEVIDVGCNSQDRCDYPIISDNIAKEILKDRFNRVGIGICGSGIGILIPASKHHGIYSARCLNIAEAEMSRIHNNTNLLGLCADSLKLNEIFEIIDSWISAEFYKNPYNDGAYLRRFLQTVELERKLTKINFISA